MPSRPDGTSIGESLACEIAGIAAATRRDWVKRGVLDQPPKKAKLSELQVVELAVLRELHDILGPRDAGVVWKELQQLLTDRLPAGEMDIVVDVAYREVTLVTNPASSGPAEDQKQEREAG